MKRLICILIMVLMMIGSVYAEEPAEVTIILNDEIMVFETPPYIINGRTVVPVRFLFEPLGLEVSWDPVNYIASGVRENLIIDLPIGSTEATVNGEVVILDSPAVIINNRTYVPLRFVAESTGAVVGWDQETTTITIEGGLDTALKEKQHTELLLTIYEDTNDFNGPNYLAIRAAYHKLIDQMMVVKDTYLGLNETFKVELITLADTLGITFEPEASLHEMMITINTFLLPLHELDTERLHLVSDDGYYTHHYDFGYYYGYYRDYKSEGYKFSYNNFDGAYVLNIVPYENDQRSGVGYKMVFDHDHSLRYEEYYTVDQDMTTAVDYSVYSNGIQAFDLGAVEDDIMLRIEPDGTIFIPPTDENGLGNLNNKGVGFTRFDDAVEYVGYFDDWDRLGEGLYFAPEDDNNINNNLMELRADEILESVVTDELTDEEKIKNIHDYLVNHIVYDTNEDEQGEFVASSHTAYGALINGVAVCDGYSEAFKYLLDKSEIENVLIFGEGEDQGPPFTEVVNHAWNLVKIGEDYYHYDLTWNDDDLNNRAVYTYYKKDTDYFDDTHWWETSRYSMYLD